MANAHQHLVIVSSTDAPETPPRFWRMSERGGGVWVEQIERATVYHGSSRAADVAAHQGGLVKPRDQYALPPIRVLGRSLLSARLSVTQRRTLAAELRALADEQDMLADRDIHAGAVKSSP